MSLRTQIFVIILFLAVSGFSRNKAKYRLFQCSIIAQVIITVSDILVKLCAHTCTFTRTHQGLSHPTKEMMNQMGGGKGKRRGVINSESSLLCNRNNQTYVLTNTDKI